MTQPPVFKLMSYDEVLPYVLSCYPDINAEIRRRYLSDQTRTILQQRGPDFRTWQTSYMSMENDTIIDSTRQDYAVGLLKEIVIDVIEPYLEQFDFVSKRWTYGYELLIAICKSWSIPTGVIGMDIKFKDAE